MREESTFDGLLSTIDRFLGIPQSNLNSAHAGAVATSNAANTFLNTHELDARDREHLSELAASLNAAVARLSQSVVNLKQDGALQADWARFAQRDLIRLKDEVLALREFLVENAKRLRLARWRIGWKLSDVDLRKLLEELRDEGAIGERTWVLFMSYLSRAGNSWRRALKDRTTAERLGFQAGSRTCGKSGG
ncbi:MAG: hypothetical protein QMC89_05915 [Candidatus Hodarchaeaceae archaeon]|nr:hypothetical protein [Candidatus Hodarchaeaceae archaeon]